MLAAPHKTMSDHQRVLCAQPCKVLIEGKVETAILAQCMEAADAPNARGLHPTSMYNQGRIHSYLFSSTGYLVHANEAAVNDWKTRSALFKKSFVFRA